MKKSELKTGMLIEITKGKRAIVLLGTTKGDVFAAPQERNEGTTWGMLSEYNENLCHDKFGSLNSDYDIVKVYSYSSNFQAFTVSVNDRILLWDRDEDSKMTLTPTYEAIVKRKEKIVKVGCQDIPFEKVEELYSLIHKKS